MNFFFGIDVKVLHVPIFNFTYLSLDKKVTIRADRATHVTHATCTRRMLTRGENVDIGVKTDHLHGNKD